MQQVYVTVCDRDDKLDEKKVFALQRTYMRKYLSTKENADTIWI